MSDPPCSPATAPPMPMHPAWLAMQPRASAVRSAREYTAATLVYEPDEWADDVVEVVSELVTNAVQAVERTETPPSPGVLRAISLGLALSDRLAHVLVRDPVPVAPERREPGSYEDAHGSVHGWGLNILDALCAEWWADVRAHDKTVHAVIPRPGVELDTEELAELHR